MCWSCFSANQNIHQEFGLDLCPGSHYDIPRKGACCCRALLTDDAVIVNDVEVDHRHRAPDPQESQDHEPSKHGGLGPYSTCCYSSSVWLQSIFAVRRWPSIWWRKIVSQGHKRERFNKWCHKVGPFMWKGGPFAWTGGRFAWTGGRFAWDIHIFD